MWSKLSISAASECDGVEGNNGFEMWRILHRAYVFLHGMTEFDLGCGDTHLGANRCRMWGATRGLIKRVEGTHKAFKENCGKSIRDRDLAITLWKGIDETSQEHACIFGMNHDTEYKTLKSFVANMHARGVYGRNGSNMAGVFKPGAGPAGYPAGYPDGYGGDEAGGEWEDEAYKEGDGRHQDACGESWKDRIWQHEKGNGRLCAITAMEFDIQNDCVRRLLIRQRTLLNVTPAKDEVTEATCPRPKGVGRTRRLKVEEKRAVRKDQDADGNDMVQLEDFEIYMNNQCKLREATQKKSHGLQASTD